MNSVSRKTGETDISVGFEPYGNGMGTIGTGIGFFDHMLTAFKVHGGFDMEVDAKGDLAVDCHHTVEDVGIVLGRAIAGALGSKAGIARFGSAYVPMDEALAFACVDISARPFLVYDAPKMAPMIGGYDTEVTQEFFRSLAVNAGITLHIKVLYGENAHHMTEAVFKAAARAIAAALKKTGSSQVLSTKGVL